MKVQEIGKRLEIWQAIVLVELVMIIFLGLYSSYQGKALAAQSTYASKVEQVVADKDRREKELSARLTAVMTLLQRAVNDLNQGQPSGAINNMPAPGVVK